MTSASQPAVIPLWPNGAPESEHWTHQEQEGIMHPWGMKNVRNVSNPSLIVFLPKPEVANGTAVIVCPGGAFHGLAIQHEGTDVARWLNDRGITAFVLKYRLVQTPEREEEHVRQAQAMMQLPPSESLPILRQITGPIVPLAVADGRRAIELVRQRADEWDINPNHIGMIGFSAGGRVVGGVALEHDDASRPDFVGIIYGALFDDLTVPPDAPPLFIALAGNDALAVRPCLDLYTAWWSAGKPAELHIYAEGDHGFGMRKLGLPVDSWIDRFGDWLRVQGLLESSQSGSMAPLAVSGERLS